MATSKKASTKKVETNNVTKIKETAKSVGSQVKATAEDIFEDAKKNTQNVVDATKNVNVTGNIKKIASTAKNINKEVFTTASDIVEDVIENGRQFGNVAVKAVKERIAKIDVTDGVEQIRSTAKEVNSYALKTADEMLDNALENTEKWQSVAAKAVNGGLKLAEKQQDIVFSTLETVKDQLVNNTKRFRGLFSQN